MSANTSSINGADREVRATGVAAGASAAHTSCAQGRSKWASFRGAWAALTAGSRAIPLGDNGALFRELAERIAAPNRRS